MRYAGLERLRYRHARTLRLVVATAPLAFSACAAEPGQASQEPPAGSVLLPAGLEFPYRVDPACPGEGCAYGTWLACESVPLHPAVGDSTVGGQLQAGEAFEVTTGTVIVDVPGVVVVTRPARQFSFVEDSRIFQPGDTLWVLDYLGEGFFNVRFADSILEVDAFWPWENFYPAAGFEYGGEVVQNGRSSFWVRVAGPENRSGWVRVDDAAVARPSALDDTPLECRRES